MSILCHSILEVFNFLFLCTGACSQEFALNLRDFGLGLSRSAEIIRTLATLRDRVNAFLHKGTYMSLEGAGSDCYGLCLGVPQSLMWVRWGFLFQKGSMWEVGYVNSAEAVFFCVTRNSCGCFT